MEDGWLVRWLDGSAVVVSPVGRLITNTAIFSENEVADWLANWLNSLSCQHTTGSATCVGKMIGRWLVACLADRSLTLLSLDVCTAPDRSERMLIYKRGGSTAISSPDEVFSSLSAG